MLTCPLQVLDRETPMPPAPVEPRLRARQPLEAYVAECAYLLAWADEGALPDVARAITLRANAGLEMSIYGRTLGPTPRAVWRDRASLMRAGLAVGLESLAAWSRELRTVAP